MLLMRLRYQPYDVGFDDSFLPTPYVHKNNVMFVNGNQVKTKGRALPG